MREPFFVALMPARETRTGKPGAEAQDASGSLPFGALLPAA